MTDTDVAVIDPKWFRQVLGQYPTGVSVVAARDPQGGNAGLAVGSFTSVSLDPPLVAFLPDKSSTSWPRIERAGSFCVNVLAADQEHVCRAFATKDVDKFAGLVWRPACSGSPIIDGVIAWIDCDLEAVHDAGDHYIVIGRVRELDVERSSLPLLFFQGGYGRFMPESLVTSDMQLIDHFRHVDLVRHELEALALASGVECNASVRVIDEIVILATAGQPRGPHIPTRVGHRFALTPPVGAGFIAWGGADSADAWLRRAPELTADERELCLKGLEFARQQGYSLLLGSIQPASVDERASTVPRDEPRELRGLVHDLRLGFGPGDIANDGAQWSTISAPVFDAAGEVALMINFYGFDALMPDELERCAAQLIQAGQRVTELAGSRTPIAS